MTSSRRVLAALVAALALLAHGISVRSGFALDDHLYLTENLAVQAHDFGRLVTERYWAGAGHQAPYYRPFSMVTFGAQHAVAGLEPWSYHAVNVALHAATAVLVLLLALGLGAAPWGAFAGAALFAVHPVAVEAVGSAGHRPDVLVALFSVATLLLHLREGRARWLAVVTFALACGSKETGLMVAVPLLVADLIRRRRGPAIWAGYLAAAGGFLAARYAVLGALRPAKLDFLLNPLAFEPFWTQKALALSVLGRSLRLLAWPARLTTDYTFHVLPLRLDACLPDLLVGVAVLCGGLLALVRSWRSRPAVAVGLALAGAAWFPVSNLPFPIEIMMAERFLYLPMAGLALAAAGALPDLALSGRAVRIGGAAVLAALLVALGLRSMVRAADWRDPATLAASAERAYPRSARAEVYAAQQAVGRGDVRGAAAAYQRAIAIWPGLALWYADLAPLLHELGDLEGAMAAARHATELAPDDPVGWYNLGVELESAGRLREARETFCTGAAHAPDDVPLREACPAP